MASEFCIVFVCQAGELEIKAGLLAASLSENLERQNVDIVAAVPSPELWGDISNTTQSLMNKLQVRVVDINSPFGKEYPIGNKIAAIGVHTDAPITVFLDSDILCSDSFDIEALFTNGFKAKPADLSTFSDENEAWKAIYELFDLSLPSHRVLSTVSKQAMLPYFNAGVVCVRSGKEFSNSWLSTAKLIDEAENVKNKRPWLDQISLPVTACKKGYTAELLAESYNYPAHLKPITESKPPALCHYHTPKVIFEEYFLTNIVAELCDKYRELKKLVSNNAEWNPILSRAQRARKLDSSISLRSRIADKFVTSKKFIASNDFLITGLPRSGTSLLCNLLHRGDNTVVINEPQEIFSALAKDPFCNELKLFYRELRANITAGYAVENKVDDSGNVIEDTSSRDHRKKYSPNIKNSNFLLATKNPLAYITRLRMICDEMPLLPKIVMIRHPLDVIESWTKNFEHLKNIDFSVIPFCSLEDKLLDPYQKRQLCQIRDENHLPTRRALYFNYLASLINRERSRITVIRYEDLVSAPEKTMGTISNKIGAKPLSNNVFKDIKPRSNELENGMSENKIAVSMLCEDFLKEWGYEL